MDLRLILLIIGALGIVIPIALIVIILIERSEKIRATNINTRVALKNAKKKDILNKIYNLLLWVPLARSYIELVRRRYEYLYPGEAKQIIRQTTKTVLITWGGCLISTVLVIRSGLSFNNILVSLLLICVVNAEFIGFLLIHTELKLLNEISMFISNLRHNYYINRLVDDAILMSMDGMSYEMRVHTAKLYEIVISNSIKDEISKYNATINNKYLRMLLSLCVNVVEYGDKKMNGVMLFTQNLENLKKEVDIEILRQKDIRFKFSGVSLVTISVIVPIDAIKAYGISMMDELKSFYNGKLGIIYVVATIVITMVIYLLNNRLRGISSHQLKSYRILKKIEKIKVVKAALDNYCEKQGTKMERIRIDLKRLGETVTPRLLMLQRLIFAATIFFSMIGFIFYIHEHNKGMVTDSVDNVASLTAATYASTQNETITKEIVKLVGTYKDQIITNEQMIQIVADRGAFYNSKVIEAVAKEIIKRILVYQEEYFKYYELLICIAAAIIAYFLPYWLLWYKKKVLQLSMEDEVNQFNSIIFMMMYNDHITVKDLLEELELFAVVFRQTIRECLNEYNSGDIEALLNMKEKEKFIPFCRIVDNLIRCDSISIDKAFDEISSDRENYHHRRMQENQISVQKRVDIAKPLSFIPAILVIIYLTLPMLLASLEELQTFKDMMNSI